MKPFVSLIAELDSLPHHTYDAWSETRRADAGVAFSPRFARAATSPGRTLPAAGCWRIPWFPAAKDAAADDGPQHFHSTVHTNPESFERLLFQRRTIGPGVFSINPFALVSSLVDFSLFRERKRLGF